MAGNLRASLTTRGSWTTSRTSAAMGSSTPPRTAICCPSSIAADTIGTSGQIGHDVAVGLKAEGASSTSRGRCVLRTHRLWQSHRPTIRGAGALVTRAWGAERRLDGQPFGQVSRSRRCPCSATLVGARRITAAQSRFFARSALRSTSRWASTGHMEATCARAPGSTRSIFSSLHAQRRPQMAVSAERCHDAGA